MPPVSILLVAADEVAARRIADPLTRVGHTVTLLADPDEAFRAVPDHKLVIIDTVGGERTVDQLCSEIRATPAFVSIPVMCIAQSDEVEERIRLLEVGADDVVARSFDDRELEALVEAVLVRFQRSQTRSATSSFGPAVGGKRSIVVVFSPKGGVGTTTIAVNLAMIKALRKPDATVIVDLDLQFGQVATHLNLPPRQTIADVIRDPQALIEPELLRTFTTRHDAGLHVLAAPSTPDLVGEITPEHVSRMLATLPGTFDSIVVDAGSVLDQRAFAILDAADLVVFPVLGEIASLNALHALIDQLAETGTAGGKSIFVRNGLFAREILKPQDVEGAVGARVSATLPYDSFLYLKAVNEGNPIVSGAPRSAAAEAFVKLADEVFGRDGARAASTNGATAPVSAADDKKAGRFGLRRR